MKKISLFIILITSAFFCVECDKNNNISPFGIAQDKELGRQTDSTILANSKDYPILSASQYPDAYQMVNRIKNNILNSGKVAYKDEFAWEVKIINDNKTLNAFCTPGGYIYVYTGLMKYLDKEDDLAGVLGHEIAHADRRHSIHQLEKAYGTQFLLSILLGNNASQLEQIAAGLASQAASLAFSRKDETEADTYSVKYLSGTSYLCNGAAHFFEKISAEGQPKIPEFLSTHPNPDNRIENITKQSADLKCNTTNPVASNYKEVVNKLP